MDKLINYGNLVKKLLNDLAETINKQHSATGSSVDCECIFDDQHGHYLLVKIGWSNGRRVRATTLHVKLRDAKIWIEEDMTEEGIAVELIQLGVPKEDIVLAFHSPEMRKHTDFAIA